MKKLVLSKRAKSELDDIYRYTLETFGEKQASLYIDQIRRAFKLLRRFPELGRPKEKLSSGLRAYASGRHTILYRMNQHIEIIGLPHDSRNLNAYTVKGSD